MAMPIEITIFDTDISRIRTIERNLICAMESLGLRGTISIISEPPLLSRENLLNRIPVLEIEDKYWSLTPQRIITQQQCKDLLTRLFINRTPSYLHG